MAEIELKEVNISEDGLASVGRAGLDKDKEDEGDEVEEGGDEGEVEAGFGGGFDGVGSRVGVVGGAMGRRRGGGGVGGWFPLSVEGDERGEGHCDAWGRGRRQSDKWIWGQEYQLDKTGKEKSRAIEEYRTIKKGCASTELIQQTSGCLLQLNGNIRYKRMQWMKRWSITAKPRSFPYRT